MLAQQPVTSLSDWLMVLAPVHTTWEHHAMHAVNYTTSPTVDGVHDHAMGA